MTIYRREEAIHRAEIETTCDSVTSVERYLVEPMTEEDIREVGRLERRCFSNPWPSSAYRRELRRPDRNVYLVLRRASGDADRSSVNGNPSGILSRLSRMTVLTGFGRHSTDDRSIVGFAGFWLTFGESHITTIAVKPELRRRHLGELLLQVLIDEANARGAGFLSLEVRESNVGAINLYAKYGFRTKGIRRGYYTDDGEDALVMRSPDLADEGFQERMERLRRELSEHLANASIVVHESERRAGQQLDSAGAS